MRTLTVLTLSLALVGLGGCDVDVHENRTPDVHVDSPKPDVHVDSPKPDVDVEVQK